MQLSTDSLVHIMRQLPFQSCFLFGTVSKEHCKVFEAHFAALRVYVKLVKELKVMVGVEVRLDMMMDTSLVLKQVKEVKALHPGCWDANQISVRFLKKKIIILFSPVDGKKRRIVLCPRDYTSGCMRINMSRRNDYRVLPMDTIANEFDLPWCD